MAKGHVDPVLVRNWLAARSIARSLPPPVPDSGGWRVDTGSPEEARRYVFPEPNEGLRELGITIREPRILLKLCGTASELLELLPAGWEVRPPGYMMIRNDHRRAPVQVPAGYCSTLKRNGSVIEAHIHAEDGTKAASGYGVQRGPVFIYDRIITAESHRRRGLATAVMSLLGIAGQAQQFAEILVATEQGKMLYQALGWALYSPYTTATLPE